MARATGGQARKKKGDAGAAKNYIVGLALMGKNVSMVRLKLMCSQLESYPSYQEATMLHVRLPQTLYPKRWAHAGNAKISLGR